MAVLPRLQAEGLDKIAQRRAEGHRVAILSTSPSYIARPVAEKLGIDFVLSTRLEVKDGRFTGELDGPACYGKGKVHWAEQLGNKLSLDLDNCWFYTDSYTDLPMLERVGHRVMSEIPIPAYGGRRAAAAGASKPLGGERRREHIPSPLVHPRRSAAPRSDPRRGRRPRRRDVRVADR